jgi:hypothetical protein
MKQQFNIQTRADALLSLLRERLGVSGRDLAQALRRGGRQLPRHVRRQANRIAAASTVGRNPKLARRLPGTELETAYRDVVGYLKTIDVADRRRGRILNWIGVVAFNLILVAVAFVVWLWWRGYV